MTLLIQSCLTSTLYSHKQDDLSLIIAVMISNNLFMQNACTVSFFSLKYSDFSLPQKASYCSDDLLCNHLENILKDIPFYSQQQNQVFIYEIKRDISLN